MATADDGDTAINYRVPSELHGRAKALAARQGRTLKGWLILALRREVERQEAEAAEEERRWRR